MTPQWTQEERDGVIKNLGDLACNLDDCHQILALWIDSNGRVRWYRACPESSPMGYSTILGILEVVKLDTQREILMKLKEED